MDPRDHGALQAVESPLNAPLSHAPHPHISATENSSTPRLQKTLQAARKSHGSHILHLPNHHHFLSANPIAAQTIPTPSALLPVQHRWGRRTVQRDVAAQCINLCAACAAISKAEPPHGAPRCPITPAGAAAACSPVDAHPHLEALLRPVLLVVHKHLSAQKGV